MEGGCSKERGTTIVAPFPQQTWRREERPSWKKRTGGPLRADLWVLLRRFCGAEGLVLNLPKHELSLDSADVWMPHTERPAAQVTPPARCCWRDVAEIKCYQSLHASTGAVTARQPRIFGGLTNLSGIRPRPLAGSNTARHLGPRSSKLITLIPHYFKNRD